MTKEVIAAGMGLNPLILAPKPIPRLFTDRDMPRRRAAFHDMVCGDEEGGWSVIFNLSER